jgi:hypothetical protein
LALSSALDVSTSSEFGRKEAALDGMGSSQHYYQPPILARCLYWLWWNNNI